MNTAQVPLQAPANVPNLCDDDIPMLIPVAATISALISLFPAPGIAGAGNKMVKKVLKKYWMQQYGIEGPIVYSQSEKIAGLAKTGATSAVISLLPKAFAQSNLPQIHGQIAGALFNWIFFYFDSIYSLDKIKAKAMGL